LAKLPSLKRVYAASSVFDEEIFIAARERLGEEAIFYIPDVLEWMGIEIEEDEDESSVGGFCLAGDASLQEKLLACDAPFRFHADGDDGEEEEEEEGEEAVEEGEGGGKGGEREV